jgi:hypothetical protein
MSNQRTWMIYANPSTQPAQIGVADESYSIPGWHRLAGPFSTDQAAWKEACRLHHLPQYHSPDIAAGRVTC